MRSTQFRTALLSIILSGLAIPSAEAQTNRKPNFPEKSVQLTVPENTAKGMNIGAPVTATDPEGDTLTYSLGGDDKNSFRIVASSGQLRVKDPLDYETKSTYNLSPSSSFGDLKNSVWY